MRKVVNLTNQALLKRLSEDFVTPLLDVLDAASTNGCRVQTKNSLKVVTAAHQKILLEVFAISLGKSPKNTFGSHCNAAIKAANAKHVAMLPGEYELQVSNLRAGMNPQAAVKVPKSITSLFKDVIYGKLFDHKDLWAALSMSPLSRTQFHENFKKDNKYPSTCPYCDLDTMNSLGSSVVEHFFPKSKFPLLAVDGHNLFSSCWACNGPAGKGNDTVAQLASPYDHEVGTLVDFTHDVVQMKLGIAAQSGRQDVHGYLELLQLSNRYAAPAVWAQFHRRCEALVESLSRKKVPSVTALDDYVTKQQAGAVLTYAVASWARCALAPKFVRSAKV